MKTPSPTDSMRRARSGINRTLSASSEIPAHAVIARLEAKLAEAKQRHTIRLRSASSTS